MTSDSGQKSHRLPNRVVQTSRQVRALLLASSPLVLCGSLRCQAPGKPATRSSRSMSSWGARIPRDDAPDKHDHEQHEREHAGKSQEQQTIHRDGNGVGCEDSCSFDWFHLKSQRRVVGRLRTGAEARASN
jgi:hypothetical protein